MQYYTEQKSRKNVQKYQGLRDFQVHQGTPAMVSWTYLHVPGGPAKAISGHEVIHGSLHVSELFIHHPKEVARSRKAHASSREDRKPASWSILQSPALRSAIHCSFWCRCQATHAPASPRCAATKHSSLLC